MYFKTKKGIFKCHNLTLLLSKTNMIQLDKEYL